MKTDLQEVAEAEGPSRLQLASSSPDTSLLKGGGPGALGIMNAVVTHVQDFRSVNYVVFAFLPLYVRVINIARVSHEFNIYVRRSVALLREPVS